MKSSDFTSEVMCIPIFKYKLYVDLVPRFFRLSHLFLLNFEMLGHVYVM